MKVLVPDLELLKQLQPRPFLGGLDVSLAGSCRRPLTLAMPGELLGVTGLELFECLDVNSERLKFEFSISELAVRQSLGGLEDMDVLYDSLVLSRSKEPNFGVDRVKVADNLVQFAIRLEEAVLEEIDFRVSFELLILELEPLLILALESPLEVRHLTSPGTLFAFDDESRLLIVLELLLSLCQLTIGGL